LRTLDVTRAAVAAGGMGGEKGHQLYVELREELGREAGLTSEE
jgi:hypothetical protein